MTIRLAHPDDAAALVAMRLKIYPHLVRGTAATRRLIESPPPGSSMVTWVALSPGGEVVGSVAARRNVATSTPDAGELALLQVDPAFRRRGLGTALLNAALGHLRGLGVRQVRSFVLAEGLPFAEAHGFTSSRTARNSRLDLRRFHPTPPPVPAGYLLTPVSALEPVDVYRAELAGAADEPADLDQAAMTFEYWRHDVWDDPGLDRDLSMAVLAPTGEVASVSLVLRDRDRVWSDMTATLPAHRNRGLARLAKTEALLRAATAGVTSAYTANDATNAPMLAINTRLGYRPTSTLHSCLATL